MSCNGCDSSKHTLADRKYTPSFEQIKTNLTNHGFPANQAEAIAQLHSSKIVSNIRHSQSSNSPSEIPVQSNEDNQTCFLKDTNDKTTALSHFRHFDIPNELLDSIEVQRLENYLSMPELDPKMYEDETSVT